MEWHGNSWVSDPPSHAIMSMGGSELTAGYSFSTGVPPDGKSTRSVEDDTQTCCLSQTTGRRECAEYSDSDHWPREQGAGLS